MRLYTKVLGFCLVVVICFTLVGCGTKDNNSSGQSKDTKDNEGEKVKIIDTNSSYFVIINGKKFSAGDSISSLSKVGYTLRSTEVDQEIPANKYMIGAGHMVNSENKNIFDVTPFNTTSSSIKVSESVIGGLSISYTSAKDDPKSANFEVYGGIKLGSTEAEVKKVFGEPSLVTGTTSKTYHYDSEETYRNYTFTFNEEETVKNIQWKNLVFAK